MGTDRAYEDPIAPPPPTSPLQKGMEAILGGPLGLSTAPAAPDFAQGLRIERIIHAMAASQGQPVRIEENAHEAA